MAELTIIIDDWGHKELKEYLHTLNGIQSVNIANDDILKINIKYNPNLITANIIKKEILLFLGILEIPSILSFDKHSNIKTNEYEIILKDICCEYCFKNDIENLFEIEGIEKVESNFNDFYSKKENNQDNIIIKINYNPDILSLEKLKQIESDLFS